MEKVNIHKAKTHLSRLVERAAAGEEIIIAKAGKPMARLTKVEPRALGPRKPGALRGQVWVAPDFDDTDQEIIDLFEGNCPKWPSPELANDSPQAARAVVAEEPAKMKRSKKR